MPPPPIDAGAVSVDGISLNGHAGNRLTVAPGADVRITGTATDENTGCPGCIMYANVAFRGAAASAGCFGGFMRLDVPGYATATGTVDLGNAPTTPGFYDIVVQPAAEFNCFSGWQANGGTTIAQIRVVAPPVCPAVTSSTAYVTPVTITLGCTGTTLAYTVAAGGGPAHGTLGAIVGNQVRYTPAAGFSGTDTFHLTATDAAGSTAAETVTVHVGPAPPSPPPSPLSSPPAPPSPPGPGAPAKDAAPPSLSISAAKAQRALKGKAISFGITSNESCSLIAVVKLGTTTLASTKKTLPGGAKSKIRLKLGSKALAAVRKALRGRPQVTGVLVVKGVDTSGNATTSTKKLLLKR